MTKRIGGFRRKTRSKLSKSPRTKGKISLTRYFQEFNVNDKVTLNAEPSYQKGMYLPRFHSKPGTITGRQGRCYLVEIKDGGKTKNLVVHGIHLKKA
ncbi:MAG: 50S ribosomal protein L21e [Nanoarchaeota archaeon]